MSHRSTLALLIPMALLGLTRCNPQPASEAAVCEMVECTAGKCRIQAGQPSCICGAPEKALGLTCAVKAVYVVDGNDSEQLATPIEPSSELADAAIDTSRVSAGDSDFYRFEVRAGQHYRFTCVPGTLASCYVYVSGSDIASQTGTNHEPVAVSFKPSVSGSIYAIVKAASKGETGTYRYKLEQLGVDDSGDTPAEATPMSAEGQSGRGVFGGPGDADFYTFSAEAQRFYRFTCEEKQSYSCEVTILDARSTELARGSLSALASNPTAGSMYVRVTTNGSAREYKYRMERLNALDDHGNTATTATPITTPATVTGALQVAGDLDVFSFDAVAGHFYRSTGPFRVFDPSGKQLLSSYYPKASVTGTHTILVESDISWTYPRGYTFGFEDLGPDDHGDSPETATPFQDSISGTSIPGEPDYFSFTAQAGVMYRATCTRTATNSACALNASARDPLVLYERGGTSEITSNTTQPIYLRVWPDGTLYQYNVRVQALGN